MSLVRAGVLSHSGHAHLSSRVGPEAVLLAAVSAMRNLTPDDLAVVRLDGTVVEGDLAGMSAEVVDLHTGVYRARPQAGAVIHTHSPPRTLHMWGMAAHVRCATVTGDPSARR